MLSNMENSGKPLPAVPEKMERGVDELNFAEFPVCLFSSNPVHVSSSGKTLEFQDELPDPRSPGKSITRSVTITGTDKYGLPTALDDWVILGLFQMSKLQNFPKKLYFTRYHLLKLLGWGTNSRDYKKLTECLRRIQGVQFTFEKAWWDGQSGSWISRTFNMYQDLEVYEDENSTTRPKPDISQASFSFACSSFEWSEFLHSNFMNRAVKGLNFHFVKSLKKPTTKRLFRFLDKRFYNRNSLEFDLHEFAEAHMGMIKGQLVGDIKRTLMNAIKELEQCNYLSELSSKERFPKIRKGKYKIVFKKGAFDATKLERDLEEREGEENPQVRRVSKSLVERGISEKEAFRLACAHSMSILLRQIDIFDWEIQNGKKLSNPGGYLRQRIIENYSEPEGYLTKSEREKAERIKKEIADTKRKAQEEGTSKKTKLWNHHAARPLPAGPWR